jgi:hypothetical protein
MEESMLTTEDNPFDPFEQFEDWYQFDTSMGYHTLAYLARVAVTSPNTSLPNQQYAARLAMEEIVEYNLTGNYRIVTRKVSE